MKVKIPGKLISFSVYLLITLFVSVALLVCVRGRNGNPDGPELNTSEWKEDGPFELSPERGRYALLYSIVEDKSLQFSAYMGQFASPDVGVSKGHFVSLFAPLLSYAAIPGFLIGRSFGAAQAGAFATASLFAMLNFLLIRAIAHKLGANKIAATIAALAFVFASPAFAYGVTLYQHHLSTFLILLGIYSLLQFNKVVALLIVFVTFGLSIPLDYPNVFFASPVAIYALGSIFSWTKIKQKISFKINLWTLFTPLIIVIPLGFFLWYNQNAYGNPMQLSGTLPTAQLEAQPGQPIDLTSAVQVQTVDSKGNKNIGKSAVHFFDSRPILDGLYIHFLSPDRGIIYYTPVMLIGFAGFVAAVRKRVKMTSLLAAILGANVMLYSMWGDPWGGWAFGSRYLIPSYAVLSIFIGLFLTYYGKKTIIILSFAVLMIYSVAVNTLGAITTSAIPPKAEVLQLEKLSGKVQKYTYERNWDFLASGYSKSFVYQTYLRSYISTIQFYQILIISISAILSILLAVLTISLKNIETKND